MNLLIQAAELAELIGTVKILDVRWQLTKPDGRADYLESHIPTAVYVDLDHELATHGKPTDGRHPLPSAELLQEGARRWGLDDGDTVVIYDQRASFGASRAWWALSDAGITEVRILDGGFDAWIAADLPVEEGDFVPEPGLINLTSGVLPKLTMEEAGEFPQQGILIDVRPGERYRGESEPLDPRPGHIPGALNVPTIGNLDENGRFLSPELLRKRFEDAGVTAETPLAFYCGSGITACHAMIALKLAGYEGAALYPGSWSEWSNHPERPAELG